MTSPTTPEWPEWLHDLAVAEVCPRNLTPMTPFETGAVARYEAFGRKVMDKYVMTASEGFGVRSERERITDKVVQAHAEEQGNLRPGNPSDDKPHAWMNAEGLVSTAPGGGYDTPLFARSAELRSMNEARAIGLLRAVRDEWYTFTPYSELKTAIDGLLDNAPRSARGERKDG